MLAKGFFISWHDKNMSKEPFFLKKVRITNVFVRIAGGGSRRNPGLLVFRGIVQLVERRSPKPDVVGSSPTTPVSDFLAQWFSRLERRPVTAEVRGSSPLWVVMGA